MQPVERSRNEVQWMRVQLRIDRPISLRVSAEWLEALDRWREQQPVKPSRTAVIVAAVELFLRALSPDECLSMAKTGTPRVSS
jgi:hypothetical protein